MTLNTKLLFGGALLLLCTLSARAEDPNTDDSISKRFKNIGFHLGGLTEFYNAIQTDTRGQKNKFDFNPLIGGSTDVEMSEHWALVPELNWVLPREIGSGVSKNLFMLRLDGAWRGGEWWRLRIGTSLMVNNIRGGGGTKTVRNGGSTSTFYVPSESRTAVNNTLDFGGELIYDSFAVRLQTYTYALFRKDRRQLSYSLMFTYYYDLGE